MAPLLIGPKTGRRAFTLPRQRTARPADAPPSVVFTKATPAEGCCLDCGLPYLATVEDFAGSFGLFGRRRAPVAYLQCTACGSRNQTED